MDVRDLAKAVQSGKVAADAYDAAYGKYQEQKPSVGGTGGPLDQHKPFRG